MTAMSRSGGEVGAVDSRSTVRSLRYGGVARGLLSSWMVVMHGALLAIPAGLSSACLIPPDLAPAGADAGPSAPPIIRSAQPIQYAFPGPIILDRVDSPQMVLEVEDADLEDTLYVQLYVDYVLPLSPVPALGACQAAPSGDAKRILDCDTTNLCNTIASTDDTNHKLEAMASDRAFISDSDPEAAGQDPFRALADRAHASWTTASWVMSCATSI
jgi:hypothetical protein